MAGIKSVPLGAQAAGKRRGELLGTLEEAFPGSPLTPTAPPAARLG